MTKETSSSSAFLSCLVSFAVGGLLTAAILQQQGEGGSQHPNNKDAEHAGATRVGDDLSLFYGDKEKLTTIQTRHKFLPQDVYGALVRDAVVCCLDIVLVRRNKQQQNNKKQALVVLRSSEPVKGVWWWPGGRLLKGETFFECAKRKAWQETGIKNVQPVTVLGVWNTFFPTSAWDDEITQGTQTVNPIVLVEIVSNNEANSQDDDDELMIKLDDQSAEYRWISLDPDAAKESGEDPYVYNALYRLRAWDPLYATSS